jgi:4-amino-4-deoxy-L-arabinose transferase-like glycosyltransferase
VTIAQEYEAPSVVVNRAEGVSRETRSVVRSALAPEILVTILSMPDPEPTTEWRREWGIVAGLTLLGAVLRFWGFGRIGMTHFDEGIYAFAGLWSISPGGLAALDPGVVPYAPPGYPILVGLAYSVLGVSDVSAILVSMACGIATIPTVAWIARRTFGPGAGAAGAAFAALSMAHIAFSRKALTDAPFLLFWLIALGLGMRFLERPRLGRAIAFGVAVGVAQNVKYNGWITGLIVIVAALLGVVGDPEARKPAAVWKTFGLGVFAAGIAAVLYWPWFRFVEAHGGYADLLRHQRSYMGGLPSCVPNWRQQLAQVVSLSGGKYWGIFVWVVSWLGAAFAANGWSLVPGSTRWDGMRLRVGLLAGMCLLAAFPDVGWWVGIVWLPWLAVDHRPGYRMLASWWLVLSWMTPFYHPYGRLWLPLHAVGWVLLAGTTVRLGAFRDALHLELSWQSLRRPSVLGTLGLIVGCLILGKLHWSQHVPEPLASAEIFIPTDGLRVFAADLAQDPAVNTPQGKRTIRIHARRPLAFYLASQGIPIALVENLQGIGQPGEHRDELALLDAALDNAATKSNLGLYENWHAHLTETQILDPVTRLDVTPENVFNPYPLKRYAIELLSPNLPANRPVPSAPSTSLPPDPSHAP